MAGNDTHGGSGGPIKLDPGHAMNLAQAMDEICIQCRNVLQRYHDSHHDIIARGIMGGGYALQSMKASIDITDAQNKIQTAFNQVNDQIRNTVGGFGQANQDAAHNLASVAGLLTHT